MTEEELREMCLNTMNTAWPAYLTTVDADGFPQTRAMFNLRNKERFPKLALLFKKQKSEFTIIFSTNTSSTKISDIARNPKVSVYYCLPSESRGVMFGGEIEIVADTNLKKALWHEGWEWYYPGGFDDPDHSVIRLVPRVAKGWNQRMTFKLDLGAM